MSTQLGSYYRGELAADFNRLLGTYEGRHLSLAFGHDWMEGCSALRAIAPERRPALLVCLHLTLLADPDVTAPRDRWLKRQGSCFDAMAAAYADALREAVAASKYAS